MSEPITKKLSEIIEENPNLRVWGMTRKTAECVLMWLWHLDEWRNLEMTWCVDAWSHRPLTGAYQQIIIFVPEDDTE